ncbi:kelch-like protein 12 [Branchiostoma floridae x Branchiostoma belcheri]
MNMHQLVGLYLLKMAELPCGSTILSLNFGRQILQNLALQQQAGRHCDIIIVAEDRKYPAHRCVLAAASNYFCSLLEFNQGRPRLEGAVAQLSEVSAAGLETALEFIYTSVVNTERCSWEELLQAASSARSAQQGWRQRSSLSTLPSSTLRDAAGRNYYRPQVAQLSEVSSAGLETALEFIYTSVVNTERCSWEELLQAAR